MEAEVALGVIARSAHDLVDLRSSAARDLHPGTDRGPVRSRADTLDQQPIVPASAFVAQQRRRTVQIVDDDVDVPVVVDIAERAAASEIWRGDGGSRRRGHVGEAAVPQVAVQQFRLAVGEVQLAARKLSVHVAVRDEDVLPAVVVDVDEVDAEADVLPVDAQPGPEARDLERARSVIAVERGHLFGEVRAHDVEPAIGIVVSDADAHPGERDAALVERASGLERHLAERPVVIVAVQLARRRVARDVDVRPAVVVEIRRRRAHAVGARGPPVAADEHHRRRTARARDAGRLRDVLEGAVTAIAIEEVGTPGVAERTAGHGDLVVAAIGVGARTRSPGRLEVHVARDEQIEAPVAIEVQKAAARTPLMLGPGHARPIGDVGEGAVAVVPVEDVSTPVADEQIVEAVVVVVADAAALSPSGMGESRLLRDVAERAVAIVVEQVAGRLPIGGR